METIGFAKEVVYGEDPAKVTPITLLPAQSNLVITEAIKKLMVDARFDCPCCGKGITIQIDQEI